MEFANSARLMKGGRQTTAARENTTLVVVATNASLTKVEATKLAQLAHLGMARTINPVNTMSDGDLVVAMSAGTAKAPIDALGVAAGEACRGGDPAGRALRSVARRPARVEKSLIPAYFAASLTFLKIFPPLITNTTRRTAVMSSRGFPCVATRSA